MNKHAAECKTILTPSAPSPLASLLQLLCCGTRLTSCTTASLFIRSPSTSFFGVPHNISKYFANLAIYLLCACVCIGISVRYLAHYPQKWYTEAKFKIRFFSVYPTKTRKTQREWSTPIKQIVRRAWRNSNHGLILICICERKFKKKKEHIRKNQYLHLRVWPDCLKALTIVMVIHIQMLFFFLNVSTI